MEISSEDDEEIVEKYSVSNLKALGNEFVNVITVYNQEIYKKLLL